MGSHTQQCQVGRSPSREMHPEHLGFLLKSENASFHSSSVWGPGIMVSPIMLSSKASKMTLFVTWGNRSLSGEFAWPFKNRVEPSTHKVLSSIPSANTTTNNNNRRRRTTTTQLIHFSQYRDEFLDALTALENRITCQFECFCDFHIINNCKFVSDKRQRAEIQGYKP